MTLELSANRLEIAHSTRSIMHYSVTSNNKGLRIEQSLHRHTCKKHKLYIKGASARKHFTYLNIYIYIYIQRQIYPTHELYMQKHLGISMNNKDGVIYRDLIMPIFVNNNQAHIYSINVSMY